MSTEASGDSNNFGLRELTRGLRRRLGIVILCVVVTGGAALGFSLTQEEKYTADASLLFRDPGFDKSLFGGSVFESSFDETRKAATNLRLASLDVVAQRTAADLEEGLTRADVQAKVNVEEAGQSDVVTIAATDPDPQLAAKLANSYARSFIAFRREADQAKVSGAIDLVEKELNALTPEQRAGDEGQSLRRQVSDLATLRALQTGNAELVQPAVVPKDPSSPQTVRNTVLGLILGLMLGVSLALLMERLDRRVRDPKELEEIFGLPILASVPQSTVLATRPEGSGEQLPFEESEAFRTLRARLRYFNVDRDIRSVVVTSAVPSEGKSTIAWNLALAAAESGVKTLLIEADLHNPVYAAAAGLQPLPGLAEVVTRQSSFETAVQSVPMEDHNNGSGAVRALDLLVAGANPPNPAELLDSEEMANLISEAGPTYDFIVLDTPPAGVLADAIPLMRQASGVILVSRLGRTTRDEAEQLGSQLARLGVSALGVVANRVPARGALYGYGAYGGYGGDVPSRPRVGAGDRQ